MGDGARRARLCARICIYLIVLIFAATGVAKAQSISPDELRALKAQIDSLQAKVKELESKQQQSDANAQAAKKQASEAQAQAAAAKASASQASATAAKTQTQVANIPVKGTDKDEWFFRHKKGDPLTFETPGGEITGYGNIDVSFDVAAKTVTGWFGSADNFDVGGTAATAAASALPPAISAGCRISRPTCPIWACVAFKNCLVRIGGLSINSKPASTLAPPQVQGSPIAI